MKGSTTGCPSVIRMDRGTENTKVAALQYAMREADTDDYSGTRSIRFGTSPANIVMKPWLCVSVVMYLIIPSELKGFGQCFVNTRLGGGLQC